MPKETFFNLPDDKRKRIIDAACKEFAERGYTQGSLDVIAAAAKVSKGSLYQYFSNKLELYSWLLSEELPRQKQEALSTASLPANADLFDLLESSFKTGLEFFVAKPHLAQLGASLLLPATSTELEDLHRKCLEGAHQGLLKLVRDAQEAGVLRRDLDADLITVMIRKMMGTGLLEAMLYKRNKDVGWLLSNGLEDEAPLGEMNDLVEQASNILRRAFSTSPD
ncbi:MAG: TetR/AcrR family transcriptional regulator [Deltaproteobacteria bacterium]|nr:TetR/AcrR family transcriptional regulator [Deltaproteobacteria bacterium]